MEITDLKTLVSVVEKGGITRAAEELHRVPSSVTTRILQLEDSLGVRLFLREGKRLMITPEGQTLYAYARQVLHLVAEAEDRVKNRKPGGTFRLGAMENTAAIRLPRPLADLHRLHPGIDLELATGTSSLMYRMLLENELDAVFIADTPPDARVERAETFAEELVIITPPGHPAVRDPEDIGRKTLLAFKDGCAYRSRLIGWFRSHGREPEKVAGLASYHAILGGVAAGMGVGVVPTGILDIFPEKDAIAAHPFPLPFGRAVTELVWRGGMFSANIEALLGTLQASRAA